MSLQEYILLILLLLKINQEFGFVIRFITVWFSWIQFTSSSISKRWEISENGLQYDFIIRDNVAFHHSEKIFGMNGRCVDVNDVIYSLNRLKSKKIASPGSWILSNVKNISVLMTAPFVLIYYRLILLF